MASRISYPILPTRFDSNRLPSRSWLLILSFALLSACAAPVQRSQAVEEPEEHLKIRAEAAPGHGGQRLPLNHPRSADRAALERALKQLEYRESGLFGRSRVNPVFDEEEIARLAPALATALATSEPSEQVRFASFSQRGGALGQLRKTEAVAFFDDAGRLNLAFAGIQEFAGPDEDFFAFLDLTDRDPLQLERSLVSLELSGAGVSPASVSADRPLWVRLDLAARPAASPPVPVAEPARSPDELEPTQPTIRHEADRPTAPAEALAEPRHQQLRERLEFLKGLYEDGLISAEEYEEQRRAALRKLD